MAAAPPTDAADARFALVFGPFATLAEAERVERTLIKAGHQTLRARAEPPPTLYAVLIERAASASAARGIVDVLRDQGIGDAVVVSSEPPVVRVGEPKPLRGAVQLAERVRQAGYRVRVAAQPAPNAQFTVRHGSFATRDEAEAKGRELARLSVPAAQVVQVR
jgi:hypothetical protein